MIGKSDLKRQILLSDLSDAEFDTIAQKMIVENYAKGKAIFTEGESTKGVYLVNKGKVEISKITADGWKQTLAVLTELHFFGELSVIEDKKVHGADATAIETAELFRIKTEDFKSLEKSDPIMMYKIMKSIARISSKNVHSMNERLMKLLISY